MVGFKNRFFPEAPYEAFHKTFWSEVCRGITVGTAFNNAKHDADTLTEELKEKKKFTQGHELVPRLFGQPGYRDIKIIPPLYGFE